MDVDDDRKLLGVGLRNDPVQLPGKGLTLRTAVQPRQQRVGIDAEANVIEAETMDQRKIVGRGKASQALHVVTPRRLGKPVAHVDASSEVSGSLKDQPFRP